MLTLATAGSETAGSSNVTTQLPPRQPLRSGAPASVKGIDFRRGKNGEGKILVDLPSNATGIDIRQQGRNLVVDFARIGLPRSCRNAWTFPILGLRYRKLMLLPKVAMPDGD